MSKPATAKLKKDLYERIFEIRQLKDDIEELKTEYIKKKVRLEKLEKDEAKANEK